MGYRLKKSQENVKVRLEVVRLSDVGSVRFCLYGCDKWDGDCVYDYLLLFRIEIAKYLPTAAFTALELLEKLRNGSAKLSSGLHVLSRGPYPRQSI